MNAREIMQTAPVIPVLVIEDVQHAVPLAEALVAGGLPVLEITLRTPAAWEAIKAMQQVQGAIVGVGTAISVEHIEQARSTGVEFIVTPGANSDLLQAAKASDIPTLPGVMTPSEAIMALNAGFKCLKFFPAGPAGGVNMLKAFHGPLPQARFCPTGGVSLNNMQEYLSLPNVLCVGGSWVAPTKLVQAGDWKGITELARQAVAQAQEN